METVAAIMSHRLVAIRSDCDLSVAVSTFLRSALRHLVVVDPDRTVRGILSADQVLVALGRTNRCRVGDQALSAPSGVRADDDVRVAAEAMLDQMVEAIPVTDDTGRVVGIVTWSDLVAHAAGRELRRS